ncbi:MAG: Phosphate ABC transporter, periplasmic phosphate-binding protein PstS [uncultured Phycisphaerae bacterium]|uniref:Phosphate-binding protein n=1 Tax=uncultured Phycisphaerae bacterium TaxID=904963 RepID=A0A6J4NA23_9BACT|nr:MAG: Phosphate ABC transporter, periplasmic phosphate-binding protein PstS [uncultured Phycisphaerae bacterium]
MLSFVKGAALAAVLAGVGFAGPANAQEVIKIDGSSTVYPVTEAVAEEYQKTKGAAKVTVGISGTGGGFKKFVRGETDISNASRPILDKEMVEAKKSGVEYVELPVAFDALTVMVNPQNNWVDHMTVEELKKIWAPEAQGKPTKWSDVRAGWPDAPIKLYGAGSDSGTFDYFTEAVMGKAKSSRGDYTASEDDNVLVQGVSGDQNALGYFGYAYYAENKEKLKAVPIKVGNAQPVGPSPETVIDGTYQPLSRPIFIYVNKKSLAKPAVAKFVEFYLQDGPDLVKRVKYVPLPDDAYDKGMERVKAGNVGTVFAGHADVGVKINELFQRPLVTEPKAK